MKGVAMISTMVAAGSLAMSQGALAQYGPGTQEIGVHAGYLWGDTAVSGTAGPQPELSNGGAFGLSWGGAFGLHGWELRYTYADTDLDGTPEGSISMPLHLVDVNYLAHFPMGGLAQDITPGTPSWYLTAGAGWSFARLDREIQLNGQTVDGDDSFTLNAGGGLKWPLQDGHALRWDVRYRYLDKVVDNFDDSLNTWETTIGYAFQF
ncbi:outer membrane beta-barrel protein [Ectothiorhodospiraceae bacterium 2226]|nr:outer membrane beta-barrel protein [Ectothiorhodospiraceae bacterium 2226]